MAAMSGSPRRLAPSRALLILAGLAWATIAAAQDTESGLRDQIDALATQAGFAVNGLERIGDASARPTPEGPPSRQIEELLKGYNYMIVHEANGGIHELRILTPRSATGPVPRRGVVTTERRGSQHVVEAELIGPNGARRTVRLVVDTGASIVVLPSSMIEPLGFSAEELEDDEAETANGTVEVKMGTLRSVRVGDAKVGDVSVGFIADERIGSQPLLGMSFLERFRLTIDDKTNRVVLLPR
jgi:aspartyl protease family protein